MKSFSRTVGMLIASALGRQDQQEQMKQWQARRLGFVLKAAATRELAQLPDTNWFDGSRQISVRARADADGRLELSFQAQGYAAMRRWAGQSVRLLAQREDALVIDQRFRFGNEGQGSVLLGDTPEVRAALAAFELLADRDH